MSSATADATFETEQFLIDRGININLRDNKERVPLHYWKNSTQIDPIETVSSLCGCKGLEIDVKDKWQKTPLHYASQRGASICAMYLVQRHAELESKDIYGNTPLGVGLMYQHFNYGIILIQKGASILPLTYKEDPEEIRKKWEHEEKKKKMKHQEDEEMKEEGEKFAKHVPKKHQNMFQGNHMLDEYGDEEEDDYSDEEESDEEYQENVFNQQNAFGQQVFAKKAAAPRAMGFGFNSGFGFVQNA
jgi:hypothetical protein